MKAERILSGDVIQRKTVREGSMRVIDVYDEENQTAILDYQISTLEERLFKEVAREQGRRYTKAFVNDYVLSVLKECLSEGLSKKRVAKRRTFRLKSKG